MTTINDIFEWELTQEDKGYESGSKSLNIPTLLRRAPQIYHISTGEHISFNPTTPFTTAASHPEHSSRRFSSSSSIWHCLTFSSSEEESPTPGSSPLCRRAEPPSPAQHTWTTTTHLHQAQMTPSRTLQQRKKRIFPQPHWMMTFGLKIHFQIDICVFMNRHSHISCVLIPAHTACTCHIQLQKMNQPHTTRLWTSVAYQISKMWWQQPVMKRSLI